jgi:serine protease
MIQSNINKSRNPLPRANYESGELLLRTKGGPSLQSGSVVQDLGAKVLDSFETAGDILQSDDGDFLHLKLPADLSVTDAIKQLAEDDRVEFAVPNHIYEMPRPVNATKPDDVGFDRLYGLHNEGQTGGTPDADIDAPQAWAVQRGLTQAENGPVIAVIDTGVDYQHPDLRDNMWRNPGEIPGDGIDNDRNGVVDDVFGYNAFDDTGDPMDRQSHGTHVAGTIGARGNNGSGVVGVNQKANLMAVKIFNDQGRTNAAAIIRGIQYADKMGARIANNSWGGGAPNRGIYEAFAESDALHIVAAGNDGKDNDVRGSYPANYDLPNIISVAATDHNDELAGFSNYGETQVDLAAPGVDIISTVPGGRYSSMSGTSMASPHVAGAAGLVASEYPGASNEELRLRLLGTVDEKPQLDGKVVTGGRLNVAGAILAEVRRA